MDNQGVGGSGSRSFTQQVTGITSSEDETSGVMGAKKVTGQEVVQKDVLALNDVVISGTLTNRKIALSALDIWKDRAGHPVDVAADVVSLALSLGIDRHKLSNLEKKKQAFTECNRTVLQWLHEEKGGSGPASAKDLRDYAVISILDGQLGKASHLQTILREKNSHLSDDSRLSSLVSSLAFIAGHRKGSRSLILPKELRGKSVAEQLKGWQQDFDQKGRDYAEGIAAGRSRSEDGKKLLKHGHQSKRLMQQFNAIVGPLGLKMSFNTPALRKIGESSLATQHQLLVNERKLCQHLKVVNQLPTQDEIKEKILAYQDEARTLKHFADYEQRKIAHQTKRLNYTSAALFLSTVPLTRADYRARALRELDDATYRLENLAILDHKLTVLADMSKKYQTPGTSEAESLRRLMDEARQTIEAKKDRTSVKRLADETQMFIDALVGISDPLTRIITPGIAGLSSDGAANGPGMMAAASSTVVARAFVDNKNQQFGRIETKVYRALKKEFNDPDSIMSKEDTLELTKKLFDITTDQAELLFGRSDEKDLVFGQKMIQLRFTNTKVSALNEHTVTPYDYGFNSNSPRLR